MRNLKRINEKSKEPIWEIQIDMPYTECPFLAKSSHDQRLCCHPNYYQPGKILPKCCLEICPVKKDVD